MSEIYGRYKMADFSSMLSNFTEIEPKVMTSLQPSMASSTTKPPIDDETVKLIWIIPSVLGIVAILVLFALGVFYCIRGLELCFIRHCSHHFTCCCSRCYADRVYRDEYIHLNETFDSNKEDYAINGR